ncbi:MAG TPA: hypothetical protein VFY72_00280 [Beijerinckiaceae bacterium]|nr:hypothetical protein [Beijerinckiaceae bacterium]
MPLVRTILGVAVMLLPAALAVAQTPLPLPPAPAPGGTPERSTVQLSAVFAGEQRPVPSGLIWRLYEEKLDGSQPTLVEKSTAPTPSFSVRPGNYVVHAAYGFAGSSRRIAVGSGLVVERLAISAGALKVGGAIGETPITANRLAVSVYVPIGSNSEGRLVVGNVRGGEIVRLPEGTYHVVSTYGESNAITRADLSVEAGRMTEATLNHRAATVTLKLVAAAGGDAFAGTAFSVLTPGGDVIREAIGAFPSVTLAEGDYVLIARHEGQVYTREFKVESGLDRDIEVAQKN